MFDQVKAQMKLQKHIVECKYCQRLLRVIQECADDGIKPFIKDKGKRLK